MKQLLFRLLPSHFEASAILHITHQSAVSDWLIIDTFDCTKKVVALAMFTFISIAKHDL
jgi:hypothetical protein